MITKKLPYSKWLEVRNQILGFNIEANGEIKVVIVGLKNEDVTQGVALRLNKIVKKINEEMEVLQAQLDQNKDEEGKEKTEGIFAELWKEEAEIHFEPISVEKVEDLKRKDNSYGEKCDYSDLLEIIC